MERSVLGRTNLEVSRLGFGTVAVGNPLVSLEETYRLVKRTLKAGINIFDTSPFYGNGESQKKLGVSLERALKECKIPREDIIIGSKTGHFDYPDRGDFSYETTVRSVKRSLEALKTPYLDYMLVHDVEFHDYSCPDFEDIFDGAVKAIEEFRKEGLVRHIGISSGKPDILLELIRKGKFDIVLTYRQYTPMCQEAQELIEESNRLNVGIINGSPLAFGMLTGGNPEHVIKERPWHIDFPNLDKAKKLYRLSLKYNIPMVQFALRFPMLNDKIATTLTGPKNLNELNQNIELAFKELPKNLENEMVKIATHK